MRNSAIGTQRLLLLSADVGLVEADLFHRDELERLLAARVPVTWPPPLTERSGMEWVLQELNADRSRRGWLFWYWVLENIHERVLIGIGGFKGKSTSERGAIELGYS